MGYGDASCLNPEGKIKTPHIDRLAAEGALDTFMIRYNAAHRGAEQDIFPFLAAHDPGIISYTAKYASAYYGPFREALDSAPRATGGKPIPEEAAGWMRRELRHVRDLAAGVTSPNAPLPATLADGGLPVAGLASVC